MSLGQHVCYSVAHTGADERSLRTTHHYQAKSVCVYLLPGSRVCVAGVRWNAISFPLRFAPERAQGHRKKFIIAVAAATAVACIVASASAEEVTIRDRTVTGAAIGAGAGLVVAGPPGAVVGGVIGAVVGGPKVTYYQGHRSYTDSRRRHFYWENHRKHYYTTD